MKLNRLNLPPPPVGGGSVARRSRPLNLIKQFYELRTYINYAKDLTKLNNWIDFKDRWDNFKK